MHPEIQQNHPGECPKCGMALVLKDENKEIAHKKSAVEDKGLGKITWKSYAPLFIVIVIILIGSLAVSFTDYQTNSFSLEKLLTYFMAGFFLVFGMFKMMDLKGFAEGYSTYDLFAQKWRGYGYIYPFIEIGFGLAMIISPFVVEIIIAEIVIMIFSGIGVAIKIAKKEPFMCVCLGTFLKVPLTKVTLIEDFGMAFLGIIMLII